MGEAGLPNGAEWVYTCVLLEKERTPLRITVLIAASIAALVLACGGADSDPISAPTTTAESATAAPQTTPTPAQNDDSGMIIRDLKLNAGEFGGTVEALIFNSLETQCHVGINVDVLREDGSVLASVAIFGISIDPGAEGSHIGRYVGIGATDYVVTRTACDAQNPRVS